MNTEVEGGHRGAGSVAGGDTGSSVVYLGVRYEAVVGQSKEVSEIHLGAGYSHLAVGS